MIRGSVDSVSTTEILGWAYAPGRAEPILVQAILNHEILGEAYATQHRPDLAAAGLGDGNSGYTIKLYRPVDPLYLPFIRIRLDGGDAELPRAPNLGFADFFTNLYEKYPFAPRPRSVFGGLWTDRTDASALLRAKLSVGIVPPETTAAVHQFIETGFIILDLSDCPPEAAWLQDPTDSIIEALEEPAALALLQTILEDQPLITSVDFCAGETALGQPSARNASPSPAECVQLIVAIGFGCTLEIVRDSHMLPEFSPTGLSRWTNSHEGPAGAEGFLDTYELAASSLAVVGPGTVYRTDCPEGSRLASIGCVPARGHSVQRAIQSGRRKAGPTKTVQVLV